MGTDEDTPQVHALSDGDSGPKRRGRIGWLSPSSLFAADLKTVVGVLGALLLFVGTAVARYQSIHTRLERLEEHQATLPTRADLRDAREKIADEVDRRSRIRLRYILGGMQTACLRDSRGGLLCKTTIPSDEWESP